MADDGPSDEQKDVISKTIPGYQGYDDSESDDGSSDGTDSGPSRDVGVGSSSDDDSDDGSSYDESNYGGPGYNPQPEDDDSGASAGGSVSTGSGDSDQGTDQGAGNTPDPEPPDREEIEKEKEATGILGKGLESGKKKVEEKKMEAKLAQDRYKGYLKEHGEKEDGAWVLNKDEMEKAKELQQNVTEQTGEANKAIQGYNFEVKRYKDQAEETNKAIDEYNEAAGGAGVSAGASVGVGKGSDDVKATGSANVKKGTEVPEEWQGFKYGTGYAGMYKGSDPDTKIENNYDEAKQEYMKSKKEYESFLEKHGEIESGEVVLDPDEYDRAQQLYTELETEKEEFKEAKEYGYAPELDYSSPGETVDTLAQGLVAGSQSGNPAVQIGARETPDWIDIAAGQTLGRLGVDEMPFVGGAIPSPEQAGKEFEYMLKNPAYAVGSAGSEVAIGILGGAAVSKAKTGLEGTEAGSKVLNKFPEIGRAVDKSYIKARSKLTGKIPIGKSRTVKRISGIGVPGTSDDAAEALSKYGLSDEDLAEQLNRKFAPKPDLDTAGDVSKVGDDLLQTEDVFKTAQGDQLAEEAIEFTERTGREWVEKSAKESGEELTEKGMATAYNPEDAVTINVRGADDVGEAVNRAGAEAMDMLNPSDRPGLYGVGKGTQEALDEDTFGRTLINKFQQKVGGYSGGLNIRQAEDVASRYAADIGDSATRFFSPKYGGAFVPAVRPPMPSFGGADRVQEISERSPRERSDLDKRDPLSKIDVNEIERPDNVEIQKPEKIKRIDKRERLNRFERSNFDRNVKTSPKTDYRTEVVQEQEPKLDTPVKTTTRTPSPNIPRFAPAPKQPPAIPRPDQDDEEDQFRYSVDFEAWEKQWQNPVLTGESMLKSLLGD